MFFYRILFIFTLLVQLCATLCKADDLSGFGILEEKKEKDFNPSEFRVWTSKNGVSKITAKVLKISDSAVSLLLEDESELKVQKSFLSKEDLSFIQKYQLNENTVSGVDFEKERIWKSVQGSEIVGQLIEATDKFVRIKTRNGRLISIKPKLLSGHDQKLISQHIADQKRLTRRDCEYMLRSKKWRDGVGKDWRIQYEFSNVKAVDGMKVVYIVRPSGRYYDGRYYDGRYYDGRYYDGRYYDGRYKGGVSKKEGSWLINDESTLVVSENGSESIWVFPTSKDERRVLTSLYGGLILYPVDDF